MPQRRERAAHPRHRLDRTLSKAPGDDCAARSAPLDLHRPGAAEADDRHELEGLVRCAGATQAARRTAPPGRPGPRAGPAARRGRGAGRSRTTGDRRRSAAGCRSGPVRGTRSGSRLAAPMETSTLASAGSSTPLSVDRPGRAPAPVDDGGVVAQDLLDRAGDQRRVRADGLPAAAVLEQPPEAVAEDVRRRLVAGQQQAEEDGRDLLLRERLARAVGRVDEVGGEVVTAAGPGGPRPTPRSSARTSPCPRRSPPARPRRGGRT